MKIPFTLDAWLKDKSQKVETRSGVPARIVCWDRKTKDMEILALVEDEHVDCTEEDLAEVAASNGRMFPRGKDHDYDLFLITPEPELTEFEKAVEDYIKSYTGIVQTEAAAKQWAAELLPIARKQLQPEIDAEIEKAYKNADEVMYNKGKEDAWRGIELALKAEYDKGVADGERQALKDLPRWKKENSFETEGTFIGLKGKECFVVKDGYSIPVTELLTKLPGFKED